MMGAGAKTGNRDTSSHPGMIDESGRAFINGPTRGRSEGSVSLLYARRWRGSADSGHIAGRQSVS